MGLPDPDVDEDVRVELGDGPDDLVVFGGWDAVVRGAHQPAARWIGVDTGDLAHPLLLLEEAGGQRDENGTGEFQSRQVTRKSVTAK